MSWENMWSTTVRQASTITIKDGRVEVRSQDGTNYFSIDPVEAVRFGKMLIKYGEQIVREQSEALRALQEDAP